MNTLSKMAVLWLTVAGCCLAAETKAPLDAKATPRANKFCDPVCELRSQDAAFSLLMETFRQHQSFQIQSDYQVRVQQINSAKGLKEVDYFESNTEGLKMLREFIFGLARQEHSLRMVKLETQCANLQAAYGCARKIDEDYVGEKVPKNLDREVAQQKLRELVIVSPGTLAKGDARHAPLIPASTVLLDPPPSPVNLDQLVEPCD